MQKSPIQDAPKATHKLEVADLILALCDAGEWDLAIRLAKEQGHGDRRSG